MNISTEAKGLIFQDFNRRLICIEEGKGMQCGIHSEQLDSHKDKLRELRGQLWWLITICFLTLISVAFQIGLTLSRLK